jgi:hypothetical protein
MLSNPKLDYNRASITLYYVVALNTKHLLKNTINRKEAAQVLADLLQINHRAPEAWMRGDFKKHPISRENFLRFVRAYRTKPGFESPKEIASLAINLYGPDYPKAIELLDLVDRESNLTQAGPGKENLVTAICNLIELSTPDESQNAWVTMKTYQWSARNLRHRKPVM